MSLHINSREHLKQRQEVKPLTIDEEDNLILNLSIFSSDMPELKSKLQQLIYLYENYKHFFIISQSKADNMEVQYETVESKMNYDE